MLKSVVTTRVKRCPTNRSINPRVNYPPPLLKQQCIIVNKLGMTNVCCEQALFVNIAQHRLIN